MFVFDWIDREDLEAEMLNMFRGFGYNYSSCNRQYKSFGSNNSLAPAGYSSSMFITVPSPPGTWWVGSVIINSYFSAAPAAGYRYWTLSTLSWPAPGAKASIVLGQCSHLKADIAAQEAASVSDGNATYTDIIFNDLTILASGGGVLNWSVLFTGLQLQFT